MVEAAAPFDWSGKFKDIFLTWLRLRSSERAVGSASSASKTLHEIFAHLRFVQKEWYEGQYLQEPRESMLPAQKVRIDKRLLGIIGNCVTKCHGLNIENREGQKNWLSGMNKSEDLLSQVL